jgi:hypothetical protein
VGLFGLELGRIELKGAWRTRIKRSGKKASTKTRRKRKVVVGEVVESGICSRGRAGKTRRRHAGGLLSAGCDSPELLFAIETFSCCCACEWVL